MSIAIVNLSMLRQVVMKVLLRFCQIPKSGISPNIGGIITIYIVENHSGVQNLVFNF